LKEGSVAAMDHGALIISPVGPPKGGATGAFERSKKMFWNRVKDFLRSEEGPTATEYAVMLALIIVAAIGSIQLVGDKVSDTFTNVEAQLPTVGGGSS